MSDDSDTSLGDYLRRAREQAGFSIRQLAKLVGINYSYLSRLESGETARPSAELLQRLADVLETDASELLAFIGVRPALPEPRMYFRQAYGMSAEEAERAARLIEKQFKTKQETGTTNNSSARKEGRHEPQPNNHYP